MNSLPFYPATIVIFFVEEILFFSGLAVFMLLDSWWLMLGLLLIFLSFFVAINIPNAYECKSCNSIEFIK